MLSKARKIETPRWSVEVDENQIIHTRLEAISVTEDDAHAVVQACAQMAGDQKCPCLIDGRKIRGISSKARAIGAGPEVEAFMAALGIIVSSRVSRVAANLFMSLNKPQFPTRVFDREETARQWVATFIAADSQDQGTQQQVDQLTHAPQSLRLGLAGTLLGTSLGILYLADVLPVLASAIMVIGVLGVSGWAVGRQLDRHIKRRRQLQQRIRDRETLLSETQNVAKVGAWSYRLPDLKPKMTPQFREICDVSEDLNPSLDELMDLLGRSHVAQSFHALLSNQKEFRLQCQLTTSRRRELWVEVIGRPTLEDGKLVGIHGSLQDVTQLKDAESQLNHVARLASHGELAAGVGHEVNNPLTIAIGQARRLQRSLKDVSLVEREKIDSTFEKLDHAHFRIRDIVGGLRDFARRDNEQWQPVHISTVVRRSVGLVQSIYENDGIRLTLDVDDTESAVLGSPGKFEQILMNLLQNARDAVSEREADDRMIDVSVRNGEGEVTITVSDNGCGVAENMRERIFDPFVTTKEVGKGTGMGLGIVQRLITEMQGTIRLESEVDHGTVFTLIFPTCQQDSAAALPDLPKAG